MVLAAKNEKIKYSFLLRLTHAKAYEKYAKCPRYKYGMFFVEQ